MARAVELDDTRSARGAVDVVIPVYDAAADVERCVESVLAHTDSAYRLVLIDDASPDPAIAAYFAELERRRLPQVVLLRNARNQGFTRTANRGMCLSRADVVLQNSDTVVTKGWLATLARCAGSSDDIGTTTPFSNNAGICSFPHSCESNALRIGDDPEITRAALALAAVPTYPDLPTGVGFCLYIRRELIDAIGVFDPAFGSGYDADSDFCMRALAAGYRNVLCDDAYVMRVGSQSFAGQKSNLSPRDTTPLEERHPRYAETVRDFIAADPLRPLREAALIQYRSASGPERGVLHVMQENGGGTERAVRELIDASRSRYRHYVAVAVGDCWRIDDARDVGTGKSLEFRKASDESWPAFVGGIAATFRVDVVHLHNLSQCRDGIIAALDGTSIPYGYTVHDLSFACPTITFLAADGMYCGGETDAARCTRCLSQQPAYRDVDIVAWRARHGSLVAKAAFLIAPSQWAASMLARYFPGREIAVIPHGTPSDATSDVARAVTPVLALPDDDVPTVGVLGAIGPDKGARRLERMVELARERNVPVRFVLIGYLDVQHGPWQSNDALLTIHGRYDPRDLPLLLERYRVKLVAYPSACPETFSLTLSEAWAAGLPVVVPPFGALAERVAATGAGWVLSNAEWYDDEAMLVRIAALVGPTSGDALAAAAHRARAILLPPGRDTATRTLALYDACRATGASELATPFSAARMRDALGYVPWSPPPRATVALCMPPQRPGWATRVVDAVRGVRRALAGRALDRAHGSSARDATKRRR